MNSQNVRVADVCLQVRGVTYSGTDAVPTPEPGYLPVLRANNITDHGLLFEDLTYVPKDRISAKQRIQKGDVLIAASSGSLSVVGKAAPALVDLDAGFGAFCKVLRPNGKVDHAYFAQFFKTRNYRQRISALAAGANINNLRNEHLDDLNFPLPPLPEQRRIAAILDQAEALRIQRRAALAQLDSLTQSIFLDMFGDDAQGEPIFPVAALVDVLETPLQNGAYYPKGEYALNGGVEMVHMSDAFNGIVSRGQLRRVNCSDADLRKYSLTESDILLARRSLTYEGAAKPCLIPAANEPLLFESSFIRVTPDKTKLLVPYLFHYLGNETIREKRVRPFVTQSTISGINQSNLERVPVVVPPLVLQQTFATRIQAIAALKATHRAALAELEALFASLQQRAFSGELTQSTSPAQVAQTKERDFSELCQLDTDKGLEALIYVARRMPEHHFYKSLKALYFADKHQLEHQGRLIYGETHCALPMGPVPQAAYDAARVLSGELLVSAFDDEALHASLRRTEKELIPLRDADPQKLSAEECESLDWAIRYVAPMSFDQVKTVSHDSAYERTPRNQPIQLEHIVDMLPEAAKKRFFAKT